MGDANRPVIGIFWMFCTGLSFVAVTAIVKHSAQELPAAQAAFLRYLLGLVFFIPMIGTLRRARLGRREWLLFSTRGFVHTLAVILWFYAMTQIPIAEVTALNYLSPVYVTLGAVVFLGEKLAMRRIAAIIVALIGALVILRPGFRELETGHIAMLITAVFFGVGYLLAKKMSAEVNASIIVAMLSVTVTVFLAPFAIAVWVPPTPTDLMWMFLVAIFATAGNYTMTLAFAAAPVTVTQPVTFLQLVWAVLLGWLVFDENPDVFVILGGGIILSAVCFITWREARAKAHVTTPPTVPKG